MTIRETMQFLRELDDSRTWCVECKFWTYGDGRKRVEWFIWDGEEHHRALTLFAALILAEAKHGSDMELLIDAADADLRDVPTTD